jgi:hypothetical protein
MTTRQIKALTTPVVFLAVAGVIGSTGAPTSKPSGPADSIAASDPSSAQTSTVAVPAPAPLPAQAKSQALAGNPADSVAYLVRALHLHPLPTALCQRYGTVIVNAATIAETLPDDEDSVLAGIMAGDVDAEIKTFTAVIVQSLYEDETLKAMTSWEIKAEFERQCVQDYGER